LALTFSVVLTKTVTRPVSKLLEETGRLGAGNLDEPIRPLDNDEIGMLATGFERMRVSLKDARAELIRTERLSAVGQAASALVHDFAQPVTLISAHVEFLAMSEGDEEADKKEIEGIRDGVRRIQTMMREVLEFARGEVRIDKTPTSVQGLLEEVARQSRPVVENSGLELQINHGYDGAWMLDYQRTTRALGNLVRNAAAAMAGSGSGSTIRLRSSRLDQRLVLEVEDDGPGIPEEIRERLFDPFVTRGKREGTGLGLAIVKNIAESQGGRVGFQSSPKGTTFMVELPEVEPRAGVSA
jgi:signal transduction histidine kinase